MMSKLEIKDLHVNVEEKEVLKGVNLTIEQGKIHALMGPNGSGKSTLSFAVMGHPKYEITKGEIIFDGKNVLDLAPEERARLGLFLSFQYPSEISGVSLSNFLRTALNSVKYTKEKRIPVMEFRKLLMEKMDLLKIDKSFASRYLNEGFSGGEKKRSEILQMAILEPKIAILDETDSGLDVDALKIVSNAVNTLAGPEMGILIITHYQRILHHVKPDVVHIMYDGRIVKTSGPELAMKIEDEGYDFIYKELEKEV
ncbi:Fe-S cluster assembly ATPase SufC [archaeon]|nr:Fe-S cluster assembly ATPase SufC [archaeon]MBT4648253.1 Fe-S cluster assembly ATPase SufC [archaeon]MBT6820866.1 Fe-S cluster assembly ATPase SufC [archaeon]MBT7392719.1 Fe-S cluster assembly ATPase SufC [archaeon]